jgi:hypothetical protein
MSFAATMGLIKYGGTWRLSGGKSGFFAAFLIEWEMVYRHI